MSISKQQKIYQDLLKQTATPGELTKKAADWLVDNSRSVMTPQTFMKIGDDRLSSKLAVGRMYLFAYDPKHKDKLPYYDRFPLIFPFNKDSEGFWGINMHYLPPLLRAKLMDSLHDLANNKKYDDTTKLQLSYQILTASSKFKYFKPCVKHYLNSHVQSRFMWIPAESWDRVLFLPLERFVGASKQQVHRDSRRMIK
jgi:hypothetical protein